MKSITYKKMDKKWKSKWLTALRSGKYRQTRGSLQGTKPKAFCSIGLLIHISNNNTDNLSDLPVRTVGRAYKKVKLDMSTINKLVSLNDKSKRNFCQIADWIEDNI